MALQPVCGAISGLGYIDGVGVTTSTALCLPHAVRRSYIPCGIWLQRRASIPRPSGYEPDELPDCSTLLKLRPLNPEGERADHLIAEETRSRDAVNARELRHATHSGLWRHMLANDGQDRHG